MQKKQNFFNADFNTIEINFRKDLNFLRAIAVISVIIYHFDKSLIPGGWLGVDLFFFISGYLIVNKIIIGLKKENNFLLKFIKNRFTRLAPSLVSMILSTSLFFYYFLTPKEFLVHLKSSFYSLMYISNFYFIDFDFYSSPSNKYLTMLHTWSLSIEEQFYLIIPIFIMIILKLKIKLLDYIVLFFLISLTVNILLIDSPSSFYNPLTRIWEFLLGALFMSFESKKILLPKLKYELIGLIIIGFSLLYFDDFNINLIFPKLILFFGTIVFMLEDNQNSKINNILLFQIFGKISYSLYLFHQPMIAIYNIQNDKISKLNTTTVILFSLILILISYLNWKFVEIKLNRSNKFKTLFFIYFLIILLFFLFTYDIPENAGIFNYPNKLFLLKIKDEDIVSKNGSSCNNRSVVDTCKFTRDEKFENIYILGDSSLRTLSKVLLLDKRLDSYNLIHFTGNDCLFIFGEHPSKESCPNKTIEDKNQFGHEIKNSLIIYGGRLPRYFSGEGFDNGQVEEINDIETIPNLKEKIYNTLRTFDKNNNKILLVYPIPEQGWNVPELIYYKNLPNDSLISYDNKVWFERELESKNFLDNINFDSIIRIYPTNIFCVDLQDGVCVGAKNGVVYYSDDDHLSFDGSKLLAEKIIDEIINLESFYFQSDK